MVAVMLGDCAGGTRGKFFCASLLGEGADSRPPPAPSHHSSQHSPSPHLLHTAHNLAAAARTPATSSAGTASSTGNLKPGPVVTRSASSHQHYSLSSMDADTGDYHGRDSGSSLSPQGAMLPPSPSSPSHYDNPTSPISPGGSRREPKQCGVCGDVAKSNHFGGRSCDSCKAFFRRSVQNNAYRAFTCPYEKNCVIGKASRKSCQYCRFEKCLSIGMEKSWVMSEQQRREMMEQRQRRKIMEQQQPGPSSSGSGLTVATAEAVPVAATASCFTDSASSSLLSLPNLAADPCLRLNLDEYKLPSDMIEEIKLIEDYYKQSHNANPYKTGGPGGSPNGVFDTWMQFCKKIGHFFSLFADFSSLPENDQRLLLTPAITSAGIIMGSVTFDSWIGKEKPAGSTAPNIPKLSLESIEQLVPGDLLYRIKTFFSKFRVICPDEAMAKILILVSLYSSELPGLEDDRRVQELQEHYTNMLECYIKYKYRGRAGHKFANSLVSLADVRELAERSLELELNRSMPTDLAAASSDHSSGGNNSHFRGRGGGSFGGSSGRGGGCSDTAAASGELGNLRGQGSSSEGGGNSSSSSGGCSDSVSVVQSGQSALFGHLGMRTSNLNHSDLFGKKSLPFSQTLSMETEDQSDLARFKYSAKESTYDDEELTQRQLSDRRIQELFKTIPPPAIMRIIHLMSNDLDIETKKTESGIKFLRKHGVSFANEKSLKCAGARRKSNTSSSSFGVVVDAAGFSSKPFASRAYMDVDIKEEQMDYDGSDESELNTIKMIGNALDSAVGAVPSNSLDQRQNQNNVMADPLPIFDNCALDQKSTDTSNGHHNCALPSNPFLYQQDSSLRGNNFSSHRRHHFGLGSTNDSYRSGEPCRRDPSSDSPQQSNRRSLSPSRLRPSNGDGSGGLVTTDVPNDSSLAVVPSCNLRQQQRRGNGCLSVQLPNSFASSSATSPLSLVLPTDIPSHVLPDVPQRSLDPSCSSSSVASPAPSSPHVHSSSSPSILASGSGSISPHMSGAGDVMSSGFRSTGGCRSGLPASPHSLPLVSPDCHSIGGDGSYTQSSPSPPSSYPSPGGGGPIQTASHACVQKQIMALSIQSPDSPNDNSNGSFSANSGEPNFGSHSREYSSHFSIQHHPQSRPPSQQQSYHSLLHQQQQPQTSRAHVGLGSGRLDSNYLSNYHQQNQGLLSTKDNNSPESVTATAFHTFSLMTSSPSPSANTSSSSNSSPENSTDSFERSLYTSPINLSGLSDVESAVLQKFFEHITTHFTDPLLVERHWNNEDLLPKPFLAMLQAKLKTEHK